MRRNERGANLVEFAIVAPLLILLVVGIADIGRAYNGYMVITNAAREAARQAARYAQHLPINDSQVDATVANEITNAGATGLKNCTADASKVADSFGANEAVRVLVQCDFETIMPLIDDFPVSNTATMRLIGL